MEEFKAQIIGNGISYDIVKKGFTLSKTGISNWLRDKSIITIDEDLLIFEELIPWLRTGEETYSTTFSFETSKMTYWLIAKAIVTLNPEKSLLDWTRRRKALFDNNIPVSNWIWTGEASIIETYYPKNYKEVVNFEDLIRIAFSLDNLGFVTLNFLNDIRCDLNGSPYYIDFGFDLGEPSPNRTKSALETLLDHYLQEKEKILISYNNYKL